MGPALMGPFCETCSAVRIRQPPQTLLRLGLYIVGLEEEGLRRILAAADKGSKLSTVNGMKLASLRAENSDTLDLSG